MDLSKVRKISYQFELDLMDQDISVLERRGIISSTYFVDSKSGVDIFKVFDNDYVNFHIGNFYEDDDRVFYDFTAELSNGMVLKRRFWNFGLIPLMSVEELKAWKSPKKICISLRVGIYDGDGSAMEWQRILTSIDDFSPVCTRMDFHSENMQQLLAQGFYADVMFVCPSGKKLSAHKCLLSASSPYFRALFRGHFANSSPKMIKVDFEFDLMKVMVSFLYSGQLDEEQVENWPDLYRIAKFYNVDVLANHSELQMMVGAPREEIEGMKRVLQFALKYQALRLKRFVIELVQKIQETKETKIFRNCYSL